MGGGVGGRSEGDREREGLVYVLMVAGMQESREGLQTALSGVEEWRRGVEELDVM